MKVPSCPHCGSDATIAITPATALIDWFGRDIEETGVYMLVGIVFPDAKKTIALVAEMDGELHNRSLNSCLRRPRLNTKLYRVS